MMPSGQASPSFEQLRDQLALLVVPDGEARQLIWVIPGRLGAAAAAGGAYEIFILGAPLVAASAIVAGNMLHDRWEPSGGGQTFEASRVLLGAADHFAAVAALIATELARLDLSSDEEVQCSFAQVEPIIELAIRRATLSNEAVLGLIAELHVLRVVLLAATPKARATTLVGWRGWAPGRDFVLGGNAVEVKATVGGMSRHAFSGVHQLEAQDMGEGKKETLHLLSIGLQPVVSGGPSLPELIDDLLTLLSDCDDGRAAHAQLLEMIASYGGADAPSYDHLSMRGWSVYQQRYAITFARLYDVEDPEMRLLNRGLVEQTFVVPDSVRFEVLLPSQLSAYNPAENWQQELAAMARG
jgi:hypothetical protein